MGVAISIIAIYLLLHDNRRIVRFISCFLLVYVVTISLLEHFMVVGWSYAIIAFCFLFLQLVVGLNFLAGRGNG